MRTFYSDEKRTPAEVVSPCLIGIGAVASQTLHDFCFNVAHALKAVSYIVPILGLSMEYIQTFRQEKRLALVRSRKTAHLREKTADLELAKTKLVSSARFAQALNQSDMIATFREALTVMAEQAAAPFLAFYTVRQDGVIECRAAISS